MNRPPAFQFYVKDWLTSRKIAVMDLAQVGAYSFLLAACWDSDDCSLPDDDKTLSALSRMGEQWCTVVSTPVRACFIPHPKHPGHLTNERLLTEFKSLQKFRRDKQRAGHAGGVKSGLSRRQISVKDTEADLKHTFDFASSKTQAKRTSSSSSSSSELKKEKSAPSAVELQFIEFWSLYPMRNGKRLGKPETLRKWKGLSAEDRKQVLIAVQHYATSELVVKGIGIKDPHRWLKYGKDNEPWRDWIEPEQPNKNLQNGHRPSLTCTKRDQPPGEKFLRTCGQPASPESRPDEPRCTQHLIISPQAQLVTHATH